MVRTVGAQKAGWLNAKDKLKHVVIRFVMCALLALGLCASLCRKQLLGLPDCQLCHFGNAKLGTRELFHPTGCHLAAMHNYEHARIQLCEYVWICIL